MPPWGYDAPAQRCRRWNNGVSDTKGKIDRGVGMDVFAVLLLAFIAIAMLLAVIATMIGKIVAASKALSGP
jgi:hypothetical protein